MKRYLKPVDIAFSLANLKQLVFEVTDICNLKCEYCAYGKFYNDYDNRDNQNLSVKKALNIIDYLAQLWNSELNISMKKSITISFYGGEPLLNISFIKTIVEYINNTVKDSRKCFKFSMTTNGILLDKYMDYLKKNDFYLLISLDGDKENTSYRVNFRGHNAFDRIVKNVDLLRERYPDYFGHRVNFNAVLHNKNSVEEIYNFFKFRYDKIPRIGELNNVGIRKEMQQEFKKTYQNTRESLSQAEHYEKIENDMFLNTSNYRDLALYLHQYSGFYYRDYTDLLFEKESVKALPTGTCVPFSKKMFVTVNGKILPCERISHQFALGRVTESVVELDFENIASKYNAYYAKLEKQCASCKRSKACVQCMFNMEDLKDSPKCHGYMNKKMFQNYINKQIFFLQKNPETYRKIMEDVSVM